MGRYIEEYWPPGSTALDGEGYEAYMPHPVSGWEPDLSSRANHRLDAANRDIQDAVHQTDLVPGYRWATESLMLQSESLSSSAIEGVFSSLEGMIAAPDQQAAADRAALGNWEMLDAAVDVADEYQPFTVDDVKELHHILMAKSDTPQIAGRFRQGPGWVGERQHHGLGPLGARYIPPPAYELRGLMDDLVETINYSDLRPLLKAAVVHAQFETIHPFPDGNGRVGRALILVSLGKSGLTKGVPLPFSPKLLENRQTYYAALLRYQRYTGSWDDPRRSRALEDVVLLMADCGHEAAQKARDASSALRQVMGEWGKKLASARDKSAVLDIADELVRTPVFTVESMQRQTGVPASTVYRCVGELRSRGILSARGSRRNAVYVADDILGIADRILKIRAHSGDQGEREKKPRRDRSRSRDKQEPRRQSNRSRESQKPLTARCGHKGKRSGKKCLRPAGHNGQHRYT